eukprot:3764215-Pleurochrysis_carterae.AAC.1
MRSGVSGRLPRRSTARLLPALSAFGRKLESWWNASIVRACNVTCFPEGKQQRKDSRRARLPVDI